MKDQPGERIAKVLARAGVCSRRDAEKLIEAGRVSVNGTVLESPAIKVTTRDKILVDDKAIPRQEPTRLWRYHKPTGLVTTHKDPEGRTTVFESLPEGMARVMSVGRLDINSEGLLLLTNDGELARRFELPSTGWLRRYRVRVFGKITQDDLDRFVRGVEIEGVRYRAAEAKLERQTSDNSWVSMALREGKNREIKRLMESIGCRVSRLIRVSYGPFQLGGLEEGTLDEVSASMLRDQLGVKTAAPEAPEKTPPSKGASKGKPRPGIRAGGKPNFAGKGRPGGKPGGKPGGRSGSGNRGQRSR